LDLPHSQSWDEADFLVTAQNQMAFRLVTAWPEWHSHTAIIFGPPHSGKTYLAKIWQNRSRARFLDAGEIKSHQWLAPFPPLIIENIDTAVFDETALFHHLNLAREHGSYILLTARSAPGNWTVSLPDLRSRIRSFPAGEIHPPGEEHLAGLLVKHFSDRQIDVAPGVISYLTARMERSMAAAKLITAHIDKLALSEHRKITRALAAKVFKELNAGEEDGHDPDSP
jgi:chromosomal replication initiation ATPase DnaA